MTAVLTPSWLAVGLIEFYQRYLSPRKGFRCAHRARKRGRTSSCSQFAKRALARLGVMAGLPLIERRFARCKASARTLDYESRVKQEKQPKNTVWSDCHPFHGYDISADACSSATDTCGAIDVPACDCSL